MSKRALLVACVAVLAVPFMARSVEAQEGDELIGYTVAIADDPEHPTGGGAQAGTLLAIELLTGETTPIGQTGHPYITGLTFAPDGTLYGVAQTVGASTLVTIDLSTGLSTTVGDLAVEGWASGLTFDCDGSLWLTAGTNLWEVYPETAEATFVGLLGGHVQGLAASGRTLFGLEFDAEEEVHNLVTIDTADPRITVVGDIEGFWPPVGLSFAPDGSLWGVTNDRGSPIRGPRLQESAFTIDTTTGSPTMQSEHVANGDSLAIPGGGYFCPEALSVPDDDVTQHTGRSSDGDPSTSPGQAADGKEPTPSEQSAGGEEPGPVPLTGGMDTWTVADRSPIGKGVIASGAAGTAEGSGATAGNEDIDALATGATSTSSSSGSAGLIIAVLFTVLGVLGVAGWRRRVRT